MQENKKGSFYFCSQYIIDYLRQLDWKIRNIYKYNKYNKIIFLISQS